MKIRNGFVSNSSSSNFIISASPNKEKYTIEVPVSSLGTVYKTYEEYKNYYNWFDDEQLADIKKVFDSGKIIIVRSVDYGAEEEFQSLISKISDLNIESSD